MQLTYLNFSPAAEALENLVQIIFQRVSLLEKWHLKMQTRKLHLYPTMPCMRFHVFVYRQKSVKLSLTTLECLR